MNCTYHIGDLDRDVAEQSSWLNNFLIGVNEGSYNIKRILYAVFTFSFDFVCRSFFAKELVRIWGHKSTQYVRTRIMVHK